MPPLSRSLPVGFALAAAALLNVAAPASTSGAASTHAASTLPVARQDLAPLFAPPAPHELADVRAEWAARSIVAQGYVLEAVGQDPSGGTVHVISHLVNGQRHFGALRFPNNFTAGGTYRTVLFCHGGLDGVDVEDIPPVLSLLTGACLDDDAFVLMPSFRGEDLRTTFAGNFASGGQPSYADRDVDDTLSLLSVALQNYPQMDDARVSAWGVSRGSAVAMLAAIRDERIRRVVNNYGFTDLSLPSVRARVEEIQNQGATPGGIGLVVWESSAQPWLNGFLGLSDARREWIKRSPCYFAGDLPDVQCHHGLADVQVDVSHTTTLLDELFALGVTSPNAQGFLYPSGQHSVFSLAGYGPEARDFLCAAGEEPRGFCGPMTPTTAGLFASADYRGSSSMSENDFVFRVNDLLPNSPALAFIGDSTGYTPAGAGYFCLGAGFQRLGLFVSDANGVVEVPVDFSAHNPIVSQFFNVGREAHLQVVFRDVGNPFGSYNFSNGLTVTVLP